MVTPGTEVSWFDRVKETLNPSALWEKIKASKGTLLDIALYFGAGFLLGFLMRKYGRYLVFMILFLVGLVLLQQFNIVSFDIHWDKIRETLGIQPLQVSKDSNIMAVLWEWAKVHYIIVLSLAIGFLLGLQVG